MNTIYLISKFKKIARITVYFDLFENINNFKFGFIASAVARKYYFFYLQSRTNRGNMSSLHGKCY